MTRSRSPRRSASSTEWVIRMMVLPVSFQSLSTRPCIFSRVSASSALQLDDAAKTWLADAGYDPVFGARPLKRVIQRALQDPLAEALLAGDILDGATVPVTAGAEGLIIGDRVGTTTQDPPADAVVH